MTTQISFEYQNAHTAEPTTIIASPIYVKEEPYEVLKKLINICPITEYKSLMISPTQFIFLPLKKGYISPAPLFLGASINDCSEDLHSTNSIDKEILKLNEALPNKNKFKYNEARGSEVIDNIVRDYFIDINITDYGEYNRGSSPLAMQVLPSKIRMGKQEATSYFEKRKKEIDPQREVNIQDLLEYGAVVLKQLDINSLEIRASKIASKFTREFDPESRRTY